MGIQVKTANGKVEGSVCNGVYTFFGIPYAAPPVGDLRFHPPVRPVLWDGVRDATVFGPTVRQSKLEAGIFGEFFYAVNPPGDDCLNLNVWTPELGGAGLPVFVWIHGGLFQEGAGSDPIYDGTAFARDGVVVVTINYRLGAQGFLYIDGMEGSGNFGILDQVLALKWVQENIAVFGGDPTKVTIAGESAGGMSVATLMALPAAKGLFKRAVCQSGAGHNGIGQTPARGVAACFAEAVGVDPSDAEALRSVPVERMLAVENDLAMKALTRQEPRFGELLMQPNPMPFQPVYNTEVLPERPIDAVQKGAAAGVDLLVGSTADELLSFAFTSPELMGIPAGGDIPWQMVEMTAGMIFGAASVSPSDALVIYRKSRSNASNLELLYAVLTDWAFRIPAIRMAEAQSKYSDSVYAYQLSWLSNNNLWRSGHTIDLPLIFDTCDTRLGQYVTGGNTPHRIIETVHGAWVEFIKTGKPEQCNLPKWPAYDLNRRATMRLDMESTIIEDPSGTERVLWDGIW